MNIPNLFFSSSVKQQHQMIFILFLIFQIHAAPPLYPMKDELGYFITDERNGAVLVKNNKNRPTWIRYDYLNPHRLVKEKG